MQAKLQGGLRRIADLADRQHLRDVERLQAAAWDYRPVERIPVVMHGLRAPDWPLFPYKETFDNPEKMLWNQLYETYVGVSARDDRMLTVRPNFWTANIPSLFGFPFVADETTTWIQACHDDAAIGRLIDRGVPDVTSGLGGRAIEILAIYRDYLTEAGLADIVHLFQPDNQGPLDCAYAMWGEELLLAMYDRPELVHRLLDLLTETTIAYVRAMKRAMREPADHMYHWWYRVPGGVRIVDDSTILLSPEMYDEFSRPYNERIYAAFGGGYMHYCGHGLQSQHQRVATRGLRGIEMGSAEVGSKNPDYVLNDLWEQAAEHRVTICWIGPPGLPDVRPEIETGLIYGHIDRAVPWEKAAQQAVRIKDFWRTASTPIPKPLTPPAAGGAEPAVAWPENLPLHRAFWERAAQPRPLFGINVGWTLGQRFPRLSRTISAGPVKPDDIDIPLFLADCDGLYEAHRGLGDFPYTGAPFVGIPWMEAILGCPVMYSPSGGFWAETCAGELDSLAVAPPLESPWTRKLLEIMQALVEHSRGRYSVAPTLMRGPSDMMAALRGTGQLPLDLLDAPGAARRLAGRCADTWLEIGKAQLALIPESAHGYLAGDAALRTWAPDKILWLQEDAMAVLSPDLYREFFLPLDRRIAAAVPCVAFHLHGSALWAVDALVEVEDLDVIELNFEDAACDVDGTFAGWKKIRARKPLVIWRKYADDFPVWLDRVLAEIPAPGVSIQVSTANEAEARQAVAVFQEKTNKERKQA